MHDGHQAGTLPAAAGTLPTRTSRASWPPSGTRAAAAVGQVKTSVSLSLHAALTESNIIPLCIGAEMVQGRH